MSGWLDARMVGACLRGEWGEMRRLVEEDGISVIGGWWGRTTIVMIALRSGKCDSGVLDFLVRHGCKLGEHDERGMNEIMYALRGKCHAGVIHFLVEHGCKLGRSDRNGETEIMYALSGKYSLGVLDFLVGSGCQLGRSDKGGKTEIMYALENEYDIKIIDWLVRHGRLVGMRDRNGKSELDYAYKSNYDITMIDYLCRNNCSYTGTNLQGQTVIMLALQGHFDGDIFHWMREHGYEFCDSQGKIEIETIKWLVQHGCKLGQCDKDGQTEIMYALNYTHDVCVIDLLVQHGSVLNQFDVDKMKELNDYHIYCREFMYRCHMDSEWNILPSVANKNGHRCVNFTDSNSFTGLMWAVCKDNARTVEWFIDEASKENRVITRGDINFQNMYGVNALMVACYNGRERMVAHLLQQANISLKNQFGGTALHAAIAVNKDYLGMYDMSGPTKDKTHSTSKDWHPEHESFASRMNISVIKLLVQSKALLQSEAGIDLLDYKGRTPFHLACAAGGENALGVIEILHSAGADMNMCDHQGVSPFMAAARNLHSNIIAWFAERHSVFKTHSLTRSRVEMLCDQHTNWTRALLAACKAPLDVGNGSQQFIVHQDRKLKTVKCLLSQGADPMVQDDDGQTALHKAAHFDDERLIKLLLSHMEHSDTRDNDGNTALHVSIRKHTWRCFNRLLAHVKVVNSKNNIGKSPLHEFCAANHTANPMKLTHKKNAISSMIAKKADVNSRDHTGASPLFDVLCTENVDLPKILEEAGVNVQAVDNLGQTVVHRVAECAQHKWPHCWIFNQMEKLDVNAVDYFQHTPLHQACLHGNDIAVSLLIENGADVTARDRNNFTPFMFSARHPTTLKAFLKAAYECYLYGKLIRNEDDLFYLLYLAHYHQTLEEVEDILKSSHLSLPCSISDFEFTDMSQKVQDCNEEYASLSQWVEEHNRLHPDRLNYFSTLFKKYAHQVVATNMKNCVLVFMQDVFSRVEKKHPCLKSSLTLTGSVGEKTEVIEANEFEFTAYIEFVTNFNMISKSSSEVVQLESKIHKDTETADTDCEGCRNMLDMHPGSKLTRHSVLEHFHGACADALNEEDLWKQHPSIYRRSTNNIPAASRNTSCLCVIINPCQEATINIVPAFHFPSVPSGCRVPNFLENQGCEVVAKWASDQPVNAESFQLGFSMYDAQLLHEMPREMSDAYKLAKIVRDGSFCPALKNTVFKVGAFVTSYILKTITIMLYLCARELQAPTEMDDERDESDINKKHTHKVMFWSRAIYRVLVAAIESGRLESNYIPGYNLMQIHASYCEHKGTALEYARALEQILQLNDIPTFISDDAESVVQICIQRVRNQVNAATLSTPSTSCTQQNDSDEEAATV